MRLIDETGNHYGQLEVLGKGGRDHRKAVLWECRCSCGNLTYVTGSHLRTGNTTSCGCYKVKVAKEVHKTHGLSKDSRYLTWVDIHRNCNNPKSKGYKYLGKYGIKVCSRWDSFENFIEDMGSRPSDKHCLLRKDNTGDFEPSNCVWGIYQVKSNSRLEKYHRYITYKGKRKTLSVWCRELRVPRSLVNERLNRNWSFEEAITLPKYSRKSLS
jgi:hypothetical protein